MANLRMLNRWYYIHVFSNPWDANFPTLLGSCFNAHVLGRCWTGFLQLKLQAWGALHTLWCCILPVCPYRMLWAALYHLHFGFLGEIKPLGIAHWSVLILLSLIPVTFLHQSVLQFPPFCTANSSIATHWLCHRVWWRFLRHVWISLFIAWFWSIPSGNAELPVLCRQIAVSSELNLLSKNGRWLFTLAGTAQCTPFMGKGLSLAYYRA